MILSNQGPQLNKDFYKFYAPLQTYGIIDECWLLHVKLTVTVLHIIKLNYFPVPIYMYLDLAVFHHVLQNLRTLYIVWSLMRSCITQCLTGLQTTVKLCLIIRGRIGTRDKLELSQALNYT